MDTVSDRMGMFLNCVFEVVQFSSIGGVAVHFFCIQPYIGCYLPGCYLPILSKYGQIITCTLCYLNLYIVLFVNVNSPSVTKG